MPVGRRGGRPSVRVGEGDANGPEEVYVVAKELLAEVRPVGHGRAEGLSEGTEAFRLEAR